MVKAHWTPSLSRWHKDKFDRLLEDQLIREKRDELVVIFILV